MLHFCISCLPSNLQGRHSELSESLPMTDLFRLSTGVGLQVEGSNSGDVRAGHRGTAGDNGGGVAIVHVTADCNSRCV